MLVEHLLNAYEHIASNGSYDDLKRFNDQVRNLLFDFSHFTQEIHFDENDMAQDYGSQVIYDRSGKNESLIATATLGDGNCYYHSLSMCLNGSFDLSKELRLSTVFSMIENRDSLEEIGQQKHWIMMCDDFFTEVQKCAKLGQPVNMFAVAASALMVPRKVNCMYPPENLVLSPHGTTGVDGYIEMCSGLYGRMDAGDTQEIKVHFAFDFTH